LGRALAAIATLLILLLGAAFVLPAVIDWNDYRDSLEEAASAVLGRKITTQGGINIVLLPEPRLHLGKVSVGPANRGESQLTAEAVDVSLSLQALLAGRVEANSVKLVHPTLMLDLIHRHRGTKASAGTDSLLSIAAVHKLDIEGGRAVIVSDEAGSSEPVLFTQVNGTLSSPSPADGYRFNGRFSRDGRQFDLKLFAAPGANSGVKLAGAVTDPVSKSSIQADGVLAFAAGPVFEGSLTATAAPSLMSASNTGVEVQAKSVARVSLDGISFSDLAITIDPQNRPQTFAGSGAVTFAPERANFALQTRSFDADAMLSRAGAATSGAEPPADWGGLRQAAEGLLWFYPSAALRLSLAADQMELKGEPLEQVKLEAERNGGRWVFQKVLALLPGDTAVRVAGSLTQADGKPRLSGSISADGKNFGRLAKWIAAAGTETKALPSQPFTIQGSLTLSDEVTAFEAINGKFGGMPFKASLHLDKTPHRKLILSLSGDSFDLSGADVAEPRGDAVDDLTAVWQATIARLRSSFGYSESLQAADIDLSAGTIKTTYFDARNLSAHIKYNPDALTISKLSVETAEGLAVRGEGYVPLKGVGQGRFEGHIDAKSAQAVRQAIGFAGYDVSVLAGRDAGDFAPASAAITYETDAAAGIATAQITGDLGGTRIDGRTQLKGALPDWRTGLVSAQFSASALDGNRLVAQIFPRAAPSNALASGTASIQLKRTAQHFDASGSIKAALLQAQFDGTVDLKPGLPEFTGRLTAATPAPEVFAPAPVLSLLGGEPRKDLRIDAAVTIAPGQFNATELKAQSETDTVTGRLLIGTSGGIARLDADLKQAQVSLPSLLSYFTAPLPAEQSLQQATNVPPADASELWSGRPFSRGAFRDAAIKLSLAAKSLKVSDAIALSGAQMTAQLENGRFELQKLAGKTLGGDLDASLTLEPQGNLLAAAVKISLANMDLSSFQAAGTPALFAGRASLLLNASGQALSPRGLIAVLQGKGRIAFSDGELFKVSPPGVQKAADEMFASRQPLTEEIIGKKVLDAAQSANFRFRHLKAPLVIRDGVVEMRRASFRNRDGTVRLQAYADLAKMQADTTWQAGVSSDRRAKWPPVKLIAAGPLRELGSQPRSLSAEDFARAILVKKMEGDMTKLEGLNKPEEAQAGWSTKQVPAHPADQRKKRDDKSAQQKASPQKGAAARPASASTLLPSDFERRMRDALQSPGADATVPH
jgi:hypothetical protein